MHSIFLRGGTTQYIEICTSNQDQNRITVDIGCTFTEMALDRGRSLYTAKTLTTQDDPVHGILDVIRIACRKGARVGLITAAGLRDIIEIAYDNDYGVVLKADGSVDRQATRRQSRKR